MLIRMFQIEVSKSDMLLKRFNWGGPKLLTLFSWLHLYNEIYSDILIKQLNTLTVISHTAVKWGT